MKKLDLSGVTMETNESGERVYYMEEYGQSFRVILVYGVYSRSGAISLSLYCQPRIIDESEYDSPESDGKSGLMDI